MEAPYEVMFHPAVFTIEEMEELQVGDAGEVAKNLFLREDKKRRYFLVVLQKEKKVDLELLRTKLGSSRLGFASEADLQAYLGLSKGSVSPFGILSDADRAVEVVMDRELLNFPRIGVHPNENTATIWICPSDLEAVVREHGNTITYIEIEK